MKLCRICFLLASIFIAGLAVLIPAHARAEAPQAVSGTSEWVVPVFLPDIVAVAELNTDKWIDLADLPNSGLPESAYQGFRLPQINAIYTWHKSVIESLMAKCSVILIDYKEATPAEFSALRIANIVAVGICGPQARVITTSTLSSGSNPALVSADLMEFIALAKATGFQ